jgi:hypothetical protein
MTFGVALGQSVKPPAGLNWPNAAGVEMMRC